MIIAWVIWSIVAILFFAIGMHARRSQKASGFFTFVEPPEVTDVKAYNHAVSRLWWAVAGVWELIGLPLLFLKQNSPWVLLLILAVVSLMSAMVIAYNKIEIRYKK